MRWKSVFKGVALGIGGLGILAIASGAAYEQWMRRSARHRFPPPGVMVEVHGRLMQMDCRGAGSPTVVLESGLDGLGSLSWDSVHDSLAAVTRTCSRSRPGVMWSEPESGPFDVTRSMGGLRAALEAAGESPPFVVVGHSIAGPYLMEFTRLFPDDVAGLVFVDASHPDQVERLEAATGRPLPGRPAALSILGRIAWTGVPRLMTRPGPGASDVQRAINAYAPLSVRGVLAEGEAVATSMSAVRELRDLGDRPLVVLTAMAPWSEARLRSSGLTRDQAARSQAEWKALHDEEAAWSSRGRNDVVPDATHYIHQDRPDRVIAAVREVVDAVAGGTAVETG